jgi:hypothetical protein
LRKDRVRGFEDSRIQGFKGSGENNKKYITAELKSLIILDFIILLSLF